MKFSILTKDDLDPIEKRLASMEQQWREWSPLYSGDVLTDEDLVKMLKVSKRTIYTWRSEGKIAYSQVGKFIFYTKTDVINFLKKHRRE